MVPGDACPLALLLRLLKASFNAAEDGLTGIQQLAHDANLLFYGSEEAQEGRDAYKREAHARLRALSQAGMTTLGRPARRRTRRRRPRERRARFASG